MENKEQIRNYLSESCRRANEFEDQNNQVLKEYWKGQVIGMIKIIKLIDLNQEINTEFYLKQIP